MAQQIADGYAQVVERAESLGPRARYADSMEQLAHELPPMLTVAQVAELSHMSEQTVRAWIRQGTLRAHRIGRYMLILRDDFIRAIQTVAPDAAEDLASSDSESD